MSAGRAQVRADINVEVMGCGVDATDTLPLLCEPETEGPDHANTMRYTQRATSLAQRRLLLPPVVALVWALRFLYINMLKLFKLLIHCKNPRASSRSTL